MRHANTIGADKFFHCMANCEAARRGKSGRLVARGLSELREFFDEYIKGDPRSVCNADRLQTTWVEQAEPPANGVAKCVADLNLTD